MSAQLAATQPARAGPLLERPGSDRLASDKKTLARALAFTEPLLAAQSVPLLARRSATRALALLLARSVARRGEPVLLSAREGAHLCGFEPRTWWLVKRRLLALGHLVASTGGGPPAGRPGGRGRKGAYFVAPVTLERFVDSLGRDSAQETENAPEKTLNARPETLNVPREERNPSHHRPEPSHGTPLRLLEKKRTSDVPSLEGDGAFESDHAPGDERPTPEAVWAWARRERSTRVKLRLLRLLETLLVTEAFAGRAVPPEPLPPETVMAPRETVMVPRETGTPPREPVMAPAPVMAAPPGPSRSRRPRAPEPLWSGESGEEARVLAYVREILGWANREHRGTFDVERSAKDTLRYPFEQVRGAVSNVLLKKARGYRFANPGAVLWDGITLEGYKLDEFSAACLDEVLARLDAPRPDTRPDSPAPRVRSTVPNRPVLPDPVLASFSSERRRRSLLQELYQSLSEPERRAIDERAESLAREELGDTVSPLRVRLLQLDKRNALLEARHQDLRNASESQTRPQESQISPFASARDETEPNVDLNPRT